MLEICCSFCFFENLHPGHKLIKLSDTESLKNKNISLESVTKELNEVSLKIIELKNKIEDEINKINNMFEKTMNELTNSYLKKHEELLKEENDLKENLKNEVTKVKEQLEIFLSESNNEIKLNERINKGIKKLENEEKNMIKILSYVSKINKTQKNMKILFSKLIRNIKFNYEEKNSKIKYEEYYFNGIMVPKNIEFKEINQSNINLSWNIDNINILNIDNKKIKFLVEMKKEGEKFKRVYEGNNTNFSIKNLDENTNYEIKICSFYENLIGEWTPVQKVKTLKSDIIKDNYLLKDNNDNFKFKFRPGLNYIINENGLIATKKGYIGWNCSIIGDKEIPKDNISKWKIKINNIANNKLNLFFY